jgi:hypothetical protein
LLRKRCDQGSLPWVEIAFILVLISAAGRRDDRVAGGEGSHTSSRKGESHPIDAGIMCECP